MQTVITHHMDAANHCHSAAERVKASIVREPHIRNREKVARVDYLLQQAAKHEAYAAELLENNKLLKGQEIELKRLRKLLAYE